MKKNIALFMIFNLLMAFFTVINLKDVSAEQNICCVMENSCGLMSAAECSAGGFRNSGVVSCNSVSECKTGCCLTATNCDSGRTKTYCNLNGGSWSLGDCTGNTECATGVCIVNGICYDGWNKRQCDARGVGARFDSSVQDCASANTVNSGNEGCCIVGDSYTRTSQTECNGGRFVSGYLCSYSQITGSSCLPRDHKTCFNGKVYWVDSCGNRENVADNGAVHSVYTQINGRILLDSAVKNNAGYCKIEEGKNCGVDSDGNVACLDMNCDVGESFYMETDFDPTIAMFLDSESVKIDQKFLGETSEQQKGNRRLLYDQHAPDKENTKIRENGETWCMLWPQPEYNNEKKEANPAQPGSRDYVFSCRNGEVVVESCGDYRSEVCVERCETDSSGKCIEDTIGAKCEDNTWEGCIGASQSSCNDQNKLCRYVQGECLPLVPPGNVFWDGDFSKGNEYKCEKCGSGFQTCDERSCVRLGDCRITKISLLSRLGKIALLTVTTIAIMASFGIGFGYATSVVTTGTTATGATVSVPAGTALTSAAGGTYTAVVSGVAVTLPATTVTTASGFLAAVPGISHIATAGYWAGDHIGLTKIFGASSTVKGAADKAGSGTTKKGDVPRSGEKFAEDVAKGMITKTTYDKLSSEKQGDYEFRDGNYYPYQSQTSSDSDDGFSIPPSGISSGATCNSANCKDDITRDCIGTGANSLVQIRTYKKECQDNKCIITSRKKSTEVCSYGCSDGECLSVPGSEGPSGSGGEYNNKNTGSATSNKETVIEFKSKNRGITTYDDAIFKYDKDKKEWFVTINGLFGEQDYPVSEINELYFLNSEIIQKANQLASLNEIK